MSWVASVMALILSIIGRHPARGARSLGLITWADHLGRSLGRSLGLAGDRAVGMTQIAALVAPPHVVDQRVRPLALHLEGGDQRVFRRHRHALVFASDVYADGEFEHHGGLFPATSVGRDARFGLLELREPNLQNFLR